MVTFPARVVLVVVLSVLVSVVAPAAAQEVTPNAAVGQLTVLEPEAAYAGVSRAEWSARWTQWAVSLPPAVNPNFDPTGAWCGYGQAGPVFFLPAAFTPEPYERTCLVAEGMAIFVPVGGGVCTTVEPPPYFGRDEAELRACAQAQAGGVPHRIAVNGQEVASIDAYQTVSPAFPLTFAEDNFLGLPAGIALAVTAGNSIIIAPPPPGEYEITVSANFDGEWLTGTTHVVVQAPQLIEPGATPEVGIPAATPHAAGREATPAGAEVGGVTVLPPEAAYAGVSRGEWGARSWQWAISLPPDINPGFDEGGIGCGYGQAGPVFFLPGNFTSVPVTITCVVPEGTAIYVEVGGSECSTVEPPPFFGADEAALRACAAEHVDTITDVQATINGEEVSNLEAYRTTSPLFTLNLPEGNFFGVPAGVALSVADAYSFIIAPPPPGEYSIVASGAFPGGTFMSTLHVIVQEPQVLAPAATPEAGTPAG